jgi:prefoldin subunit 5
MIAKNKDRDIERLTAINKKLFTEITQLKNQIQDLKQKMKRRINRV